MVGEVYVGCEKWPGDRASKSGEVAVFLMTTRKTT